MQRLSQPHKQKEKKTGGKGDEKKRFVPQSASFLFGALEVRPKSVCTADPWKPFTV